MEVVQRQTRRRGSTDDRVWATQNDDRVVAVLADGAGGVPGGAEAAQLVVDGVRELCRKRAFPSTPQGLCALLTRLDEDIHRVHQAGETTAIVVVAAGGTFIGASCGDSECWVVDRDEHQIATADQIRKRLGSRRSRPVHFGPLVLGERRVLLASDGLTGHASPAKLLSACRAPSLEEAASALVETPRTSDGSYDDDVSIVLLDACAGLSDSS